MWLPMHDNVYLFSVLIHIHKACTRGVQGYIGVFHLSRLYRCVSCLSFIKSLCYILEIWSDLLCSASAQKMYCLDFQITHQRLNDDRLI